MSDPVAGDVIAPEAPVEAPVEQTVEAPVEAPEGAPAPEKTQEELDKEYEEAHEAEVQESFRREDETQQEYNERVPAGLQPVLPAVEHTYLGAKR